MGQAQFLFYWSPDRNYLPGMVGWAFGRPPLWSRWHTSARKSWIIFCIRDQSRYVTSQWETSLHCNDVSHWPDIYLGWSLCIMPGLQWPTLGIAIRYSIHMPLQRGLDITMDATMSIRPLDNKAITQSISCQRNSLQHTFIFWDFLQICKVRYLHFIFHYWSNIWMISINQLGKMPTNFTPIYINQTNCSICCINNKNYDISFAVNQYFLYVAYQQK